METWKQNRGLPRVAQIGGRVRGDMEEWKVSFRGQTSRALSLILKTMGSCCGVLSGEGHGRNWTAHGEACCREMS